MPSADKPPRLSLLLPTRGRPGLAMRFLDSVAVTARHASAIEIVLLVDRDDPESHDLDHPALHVRRIVRPGMAMGAMVRACYAESTGDVVMLMNDDVVCRTPDWDRAVLGACEAFADGVAMVWCNDLYRGPAMPNFPALPRRTCELLGGICPPDYHRDYVDTHLYDVFAKLRQAGHPRWVYLPDVIIEHLHFEAGKAEFDATYRKPRLCADELSFVAWEGARRRMAAAMARSIRREAACAS